MEIPEIEQQIGIQTYATKTPGIGGTIKQAAEDFIVKEILVDGSKATKEKNQPTQPLGATKERQRFLICILAKKNCDTLIVT